MSQIARTVVLTGALAGRTINLRGLYPFVNGELTITGDEHDVNCEVKTLQRNFSCLLKGEVSSAAQEIARSRFNELPEDVIMAGVGVMRQSAPDGLSDTDLRVALINVLTAMDNAMAVHQGAYDGQRHLQEAGANPNGSAAVQGDLQPNGAGAGAPAADVGSGAAPASSGEAGSVPGGDGQPAQLNVTPLPPHDPTADKDPQHVVDEKLKRAVLGLDPTDDTAWTAEGKPAMAAVSKAYGSAGITRDDVEAVAPGYRRPS